MPGRRTSCSSHCRRLAQASSHSASVPRGWRKAVSSTRSRSTTTSTTARAGASRASACPTMPRRCSARSPSHPSTSANRSQQWSSVMLGMTSVPPSPSAARSASISPKRPAIHRSDLREGRVDLQHLPGAHAQHPQLVGNGVDAEELLGHRDSERLCRVAYGGLQLVLLEEAGDVAPHGVLHLDALSQESRFHVLLRLAWIEDAGAVRRQR